MKKTIIITHIDNCSHGYYSVSKKDLISLGYNVNEISGYSGHNLTRVFLEEDMDASNFVKFLKAKGIAYNVKDSYNPNFKISHNFKPALFGYVPKLNDVIISGTYKYTVKKLIKNCIIVENLNGVNYRISLSNPFKYIDDVL